MIHGFGREWKKKKADYSYIALREPGRTTAIWVTAVFLFFVFLSFCAWKPFSTSFFFSSAGRTLFGHAKIHSRKLLFVCVLRECWRQVRAARSTTALDEKNDWKMKRKHAPFLSVGLTRVEKACKVISLWTPCYRNGPNFASGLESVTVSLAMSTNSASARRENTPDFAP